MPRPLVTAAWNSPGWTGRVGAGRDCGLRHTAVINLTTWSGVIVPTRETPVAERTMCDDGNDAP